MENLNEMILQDVSCAERQVLKALPKDDRAAAMRQTLDEERKTDVLSAKAG